MHYTIVIILSFLLHGEGYWKGSDTWVWKGSRHLRASLHTAQSAVLGRSLSFPETSPPLPWEVCGGVTDDKQRWGAAAAGNSPAARRSNAGCSHCPPQPPGAVSSRAAQAPAPWSLPPSRRQRREGQPPRDGESRFIKTKRALVKRSFQT